MTQQVNIYRWDDPGAPQLTLEHGSMTALLRKCLIDGYGEKQPAGWVLDEISADSKNMIFSPASGKWHYLLYDDGRNTYLGNSYALLGAIDAWQNIETPLSALNYADWTIRIGERSYPNQGLDKRASKWCILANAETVYILQLNVGSTSHCAGAILGQIDCGAYTDCYVCLASNPNWLDLDTLQFLFPYTFKEQTYIWRTNAPILANPNNPSGLSFIKETTPKSRLDPHAKQEHVKWEMWADLGIVDDKDNLVGKFPFLQTIYIGAKYNTKADFEIVDGYLYLKNYRWKIQ